MRVAWQEWGHVVVATLALLPLAAAVVVALVRWRTRSGTTAAVAWRHSVAEVGLLVGTAPWLWMVLTPRAGAGEVRPVPLRDLAGQLAGDPGVAVAQVGGNLLVFAACGALAPLRFPVLARLPVLVGVVAAGSLAVET
ncbi:MAG: VanZ family protein, partial [Micromonosporaceae bacterium]